LVDPPDPVVEPGCERPAADNALAAVFGSGRVGVGDEPGAEAGRSAYRWVGDLGFEVDAVASADLYLLGTRGDDAVDDFVEPPFDVVDWPGFCGRAGGGWPEVEVKKTTRPPAVSGPANTV